MGNVRQEPRRAGGGGGPEEKVEVRPSKTASQMRTDDGAAAGDQSRCVCQSDLPLFPLEGEVVSPKITGSRKRLDTGYWF